MLTHFVVVIFDSTWIFFMSQGSHCCNSKQTTVCLSLLFLKFLYYNGGILIIVEYEKFAKLGHYSLGLIQ